MHAIAQTDKTIERRETETLVHEQTQKNAKTKSRNKQTDNTSTHRNDGRDGQVRANRSEVEGRDSGHKPLDNRPLALRASLQTTERQRQRERERETERQTERDRDRHRHTSRAR
jgi:hypothetical protein